MFSQKVHRYIFLFGVLALGFGMMMGTVPTSVPQIILMANWLLEMDFRNKWQRLRNNGVFWMLSAVFLYHVIGLFYSQDLNAGWNDVRTKIPLMFLPMLFMSSDPLRKNELLALFHFFLLGCVCNTAWCYLYTHVLHNNEVVRNASRFMSHIRLGLYLNIAIAVCIYLFIEMKKISLRFLYSFLSVYFLFSFYALGLMSGLTNFILLLFLSLCVLIWRQKVILKAVSLIVLAAFIGLIGKYVIKIKEEQLDIVESPVNTALERTPWGTPYIHFDSTGQKENGYYVLVNIQLDELQRGWKARMPSDSFNYDQQFNMGRYEVLTRYLASKGMTKDSATVASLTAEDLNNVSDGISNYRYPGWSFLHRRIYELVNEYDEFRNNRHVNGHSLTMRLYFWKGALHVIASNIFYGVGTGDVQAELNKAYQQTNSPLSEEWYKRPHNQFLTIWLALGLPGLLIFIGSLVLPVLKLRKQIHVLYWPFIIVAIGSFMVEDTLETQAGLTFFAFFNSVFLALAWHEQGENKKGLKEIRMPRTPVD